ncbi:GNAT family N-acetyltransferase [Solicola sp. PLA-1-18]|uniref:GNAT family N-acetyltransferase n=1 Tax=Solicola sp. PLA-1-18 TaxID=3380532 RepID=UPI003B812757
MSEPVIRTATADDAEAAAACHVACWREAYAGLVDADVLARRTGDLATRIERWRAFATQDPPRWLATWGDEVVGFAAAGPGRDDDVEVALELYAIYVRAAWHGAGVATRLLHRAIGDAPAYLWMFDGNARAASFYARHRFVPDGTRKHDPDFGVDEVRLTRRQSSARR